MGRTLIPKGGNDKIMTPDYLAQYIVDYFEPNGRIIEPCYGQGAFIRAIRNYHKRTGLITELHGCEIDDGVDFFNSNTSKGNFNWLITNPPFSILTKFLEHSMQMADNVVFLCLENAFFQKKRLRLMKEYDFGFKEILHVDTPPKPWPQFGLQVGVVHIQKGYKGNTKINYAK